MDMEIITHKETLENMRQSIVDLLNNCETKENINKDKLDLILEYILDLNNILDNHEVRLRLIEGCFNKVKHTYYHIDLSN